LVKSIEKIGIGSIRTKPITIEPFSLLRRKEGIKPIEKKKGLNGMEVVPFQE